MSPIIFIYLLRIGHWNLENVEGCKAKAKQAQLSFGGREQRFEKLVP